MAQSWESRYAELHRNNGGTENCSQNAFLASAKGREIVKTLFEGTPGAKIRDMHVAAAGHFEVPETSTNPKYVL